MNEKHTPRFICKHDNIIEDGKGNHSDCIRCEVTKIIAEVSTNLKPSETIAKAVGKVTHITGSVFEPPICEGSPVRCCGVGGAIVGALGETETLELYNRLVALADKFHYDQDDVVEMNLYKIFNALFGFTNDDVQSDIINMNDFEEESLIQISEHLKEKGY